MSVSNVMRLEGAATPEGSALPRAASGILHSVTARRVCCLLVVLSSALDDVQARGSEGHDAAAGPEDTERDDVRDDVRDDDEDTDVVEVVGRTLAGSSHFIDQEYLERYEHDDVHKVLQSVPGVYIRQEDGYGLRPNIGMRGSGSERSAKVVLMEDGVLVAPAPYSAPAAYYFPMLTKMVGIEVLKGPSSIRHGPNTVGGSVNLLTRPIPERRSVGLDFAGGTDLYGKAHVYFGESTEHVGWLIEGVKLRCDGFKELDNGGPTGFDKHDISARFRIHSSASARVHHGLEARIGYADEVSHETYTGITTDDFRKTPYRRYAATQLDLMQWQHQEQRLTYRLATAELDVVATLYRHTFQRDWYKLNRFNTYNEDNSLHVIMLNPKGINIAFYDVLTGQQDSYNNSQQLRIGSNDLEYLSEGGQLEVSTEQHWLGWGHSLQLGTRLHYDHADRHTIEDPYNMRSGVLVRDSRDRRILRDVRDSTRAWATYYQHRATHGPWTLTAGARGELINAHHTGLSNIVIPESKHRYFVFVPGGGVVYRPIAELELLAGVHRGFVPKNPTTGEAGSPELTVNYEAGFRFDASRISVTAIGFFSNFSNLIGTCRFSTGCMADRVGLDFSAGAVHSWGAEADGLIQIPVSATLSIPLRVAYTYQHATFQQFFVSENNQWGAVFPGYELPYLPEHQLYVSTGLRAKRWNVEAYGHYTGEMRDMASIEEGLGAPTDATFVINGSARYTFEGWGSLYLTVENLLDQPYIVSRRPMGARSGVPRRFVLGYKNRFDP